MERTHYEPTRYGLNLSSSSYFVPLSFKRSQLGRAMDQAVCHRSLNAEAQVRLQVSPYGICNSQIGTYTSFPPSAICSETVVTPVLHVVHSSLTLCILDKLPPRPVTHSLATCVRELSV